VNRDRRERDRSARNGTLGAKSSPSQQRISTIAAVPQPAEASDLQLAYTTGLGTMYEGTVEAFLASPFGRALRNDVQLVFTSPPFPLNRKKRYGNKIGDDYLDWLESLAEPLGDMLTEDGSLVVELGNAWEPGEPVMSTLALKALLKLLESGGFHLCQQFVVHNPARLPSPAQWVNVERIRVKDAYTNVWWMSRTTRPKADNRRVLSDYSPAMRKLLERGNYNAGERPSQHNIGQTSFLTDHGGAIPPNVLTISNTRSTDEYRRYCKEHDLKIHPARMPPELAEFFIRFLTDEGDVVFDPFGGSNTTGATAEALNRLWFAVEPDRAYIESSRGRFPSVEDTGSTTEPEQT
jgi:site-specific DNA-methyltransferase (cytosine-N4-specific)